ncbi:ABC transporter permease [Paraburkholderia piptadeniae]|uniref:ABC transporter permease n=1 Tax=Paraburkholderia piptadeniae TaxID=1701573 RepID=A0A1N7RVR3_9BURK|nr:ABC transporter permease [Paraburkholderia piptadeniae]SIT39212.1 ABC transporter permease [Paraburkholderia piptadeniae]
MTDSAIVSTDSSGSGLATARVRPRGRISRAALLIPVLAFLGLVFLYPIFTMTVKSVTDIPSGASAWSNFEWFFSDRTNMRIYWNTLVTAFKVTVFCVLVAYPMAYAMMRARGVWKLAILGVVLLPFWTSAVVRNFAWVVILQDRGVVNYVLSLVGAPPVSILGTATAVTIGMAQVLLPFAVLPIYTSMQKIDASLMRAALMLGARPIVAFFTVFLPLSMTGVFAGAVLVFVLSLGFYVTPAILGSPRDAMLPQIIYAQVTELLAWGRSSAMAVVLLVTTVGILASGAVMTRTLRNRIGTKEQ